MKRFLYTFLKIYLFWLIFFAFFRVLFIILNFSYAEDVPLSSLLVSFGPGLRMDLAFSGYLMLLSVVIQLLFLPVFQKFCFTCMHWQSFILIPVFTGLLLGDANLYRYWAGHLNSEAIGFLKTPGIILNSVHWLEGVIFFVILVILSWALLTGYRKLLSNRQHQSVMAWKKVAMNWGLTLFTGALLIIPIRGSFGVAPINTSVAYFSNHLFANHAAINPLWNLAYSMKRSGVSDNDYQFMDKRRAEELFSGMMKESGRFTPVLKTDRPDIVVILLESFSAQAIGALGGTDVTPNLNELMKDGIFFQHLYATSFRSDYGMVGVLAGYPGIPGYSVMQYPEKSGNLNFIPQELKKNGYVDLNFLYGGDMAFKNLRSLITLAGFDDVVDIDDFPEEYQGEKWGVHDEHTFEKFVDVIEGSKSPSFNFLFTLSSHEPFDVPMERVYEDDYLNAVHYTDRCLGEFFDQIKERGLWDNKLFVLVADHGVVGQQKASYVSKLRYKIPMVWTGGAISVKDTVVNTYGSQIDLAATLLDQLDMDSKAFMYSKNILDRGVKGFSFLQHPEGFGYINENVFQMFDKGTSKIIKMEGADSSQDSIKAKVFMQIIAEDFKTRLSNGTE
ncbi:LTA synthase family protein [Marinilabilia rubra]|uniref:Sulfatase n=1 Tax=Marinilabilia rubra TaxID=2162893 RepID=A0A2U2B8Q3_9BACT|nr:alkaline phosphatase family protein [Marinilabilia rubra]PWD99423.1 sulfatase [Marinilabilia rubra]